MNENCGFFIYGHFLIVSRFIFAQTLEVKFRLKNRVLLLMNTFRVFSNNVHRTSLQESLGSLLQQKKETAGVKKYHTQGHQ